MYYRAIWTVQQYRDRKEHPENTLDLSWFRDERIDYGLKQAGLITFILLYERIV